MNNVELSRSLREAWVEMLKLPLRSLVSVGRSLRGAWVEISDGIEKVTEREVAPFGERGLKSGGLVASLTQKWSLPTGSVD